MRKHFARRSVRSAKLRSSIDHTMHILERRVLLSAFTAGDIVVYQEGNGSTAFTANTLNPVFLDEYSPTGTLVQQIPLPATANGLNQPLTASATSAATQGTEGFLTLSSD